MRSDRRFRKQLNTSAERVRHTAAAVSIALSSRIVRLSGPARESEERIADLEACLSRSLEQAIQEPSIRVDSAGAVILGVGTARWEMISPLREFQAVLLSGRSEGREVKTLDPLLRRVQAAVDSLANRPDDVGPSDMAGLLRHAILRNHLAILEKSRFCEFQRSPVGRRNRTGKSLPAMQRWPEHGTSLCGRNRGLRRGSIRTPQVWSTRRSGNWLGAVRDSCPPTRWSSIRPALRIR